MNTSTSTTIFNEGIFQPVILFTFDFDKATNNIPSKGKNSLWRVIVAIKSLDNFLRTVLLGDIRTSAAATQRGHLLWPIGLTFNWMKRKHLSCFELCNAATLSCGIFYSLVVESIFWMIAEVGGGSEISCMKWAREKDAAREKAELAKVCHDSHRIKQNLSSSPSL